MKKITLIFVLITTITTSQTLCESGFAGTYPCNGVDLMSHIPLSTFGATDGTDSWGWTDAETGREYALMGVNNGTCFVDISDPVNPVYLGKLNTQTGSSDWRDIKIYNNHAFIVSEAGGHGMQVFDLTRLRDVTSAPEIFTADAHNDSFGSAHNIAINEDSGYAYIIGASSFNGGPIFINIQDPLNPTNDGGYGGEGYSHDAQIIIYNGPDTEHIGKEIYIGFNESSVVIVDVTNKSNPITLSESVYSSTSYTHQGWFDEAHQYLYLNDEGDESNFGFNTRSIVFDASDLDNPTFKMEYYGTTPSIDHNYYIKGNELFLANYRAGLRIIDISDIANNNMSELAFFDTYPDSNSASFNGAWNVYPYFESGNILISDIEGGLFVVRNTPLPVFNLDASVKFENDELVCGENSIIPKIQVTNKGLTTLTNLDITYTLPNGSPVNTTWTGSLSQNESDIIILNEIGLNQGDNSFSVQSSNPNGSADQNTINDSNISNVTVLESFLTTQVHLELLTDSYGSEVTWQFRDNDDVIQYSGGPYGNFQTINESFNVADNQCYTFEIIDSFGDGICCDEGNGNYTLKTDDNTLIAEGGDYDASESTKMSTTITLGNTTNELQNISIYPNPSNTNITIQSNDLVIKNIVLFDLLGKKIQDYQINTTNPIINIKNLNNGIYFVKINNNSKVYKIIKK